MNYQLTQLSSLFIVFFPHTQIHMTIFSTNVHHVEIQYLCWISIVTFEIVRARNVYFGDAPNIIKQPSDVPAHLPYPKTQIQICYVSQPHDTIIRDVKKFVRNTRQNTTKLKNNNFFVCVFFCLSNLKYINWNHVDCQ